MRLNLEGEWREGRDVCEAAIMREARMCGVLLK
jgi:hypothetical protein